MDVPRLTPDDRGKDRKVLRVPLALDATGRLVTPAEATSRVGLRCPDSHCGSRLSLHAGQVRVRHFVHLDEGRCSYESYRHAVAKHMLATVVRDAISGQGKRPVVHRRCPKCAKQTQEQLPAAVRDAKVEAPLGGLRPDVLLFDGVGKPFWAVEVLHTHAVTPEKAERLQIPWLELAADEVLSDLLSWRPRNDGLGPAACCTERKAGDRRGDLRVQPAPIRAAQGHGRNFGGPQLLMRLLAQRPRPIRRKFRF